MSAVAVVRRRSNRPAGFTLVELLVVIMIIALLAAIVTPAVMRSLSTARAAAVKTEIELLQVAIFNYRNEYGSFPPCRDFVDNDGSPPLYTLNASNGAVATDRVRKHLRRLFPQMITGTNASYQNELLALNSIAAPTLVTQNGNGPNNPRPNLYESNALYFWLGGYSTSPTNPFSGGTRRKLFDFDISRVAATSVPSGQYTPPNLKDSPYLYRESGAYYITPSGSPAAHLEFDPRTSEDRNNNGVLDGGEDLNANGRIDPSGEDINGNMTLDPGEDVNNDGRLNFGEPFNKDSFQIICAGRDGVLGTDDDQSNFWKSTRKDFLESLR